MQDWLLRLRAALSPQAVAMLMLTLVLLCLILGTGTFSGKDSEKTALEMRIADTLSAIEGVGNVNIVIFAERAGEHGAGSERPTGACIVAQGADDPLVRLNLQEAVCTLLGLPASAVSVMAGGE